MLCGRKCLFILLLIGFVSISGIFARGNRELPAAELATSGTQYISPNDDGVQEEASITFEVTVYVKSEEGYVPEYGISLEDSSGNVIRQVVVREESDIGWFMRLFRTFQAFTLEKTIDWDGRDGEGNPATDGVYTASMWIIAGSEKRTDLPLDDFVVDTRAPSASAVDPEPLIFSPNGDGNLDDLTIVQSDGSTEDLWTGQLADQSGGVVKTYTWENSGPDTLTWDGKDDSGALALDGIYKFNLTSTDRAGNTFYYAIEDIELNTIETPVSLELERIFISPNGDGVKDTVTIELFAEVAADIVSWEAVVYDDAAAPVRTYGGESDPPAEVVFDGLDDGDNPVDQGDYRAVFRLWYRNGNNPNAAASFHIDTTPPVVTVGTDRLRISPNDDGIRDTVSITLKSNEIATWTGAMIDSTGKVLLPTDSEKTTSLIVWYGEDTTGSIMGDGTYYFQAEFTDRSGNSYTTPQEAVIIDLTPPVVTFDTDKDYFSPDEDGIKDTLTASFTSNENVRGILTIRDSAGRDMGTLGGFGRAYQPVSGSLEYVWNGISGSGLYLPDGDYTVESNYEDLAGNRISLPEVMFTVDTREAWVSAVAPKGFSPNADGIKDVLTIDVSAGFYDTVESWKASYTDATGTVMNVQEGSGTLPSQLEWKGGMQYAPNVVTPEGRYTVELDVAYRKGSVVSASSNPFFVDISPPAVSLRATADPFAKAGESSMEGDIYVTLQIADAHDVIDWSLDVVSPTDGVVRSFSGAGDLEDQVIWRGEAARVSDLPIAEMVVLRVLVVDEVGNQTLFEQQVPLDLLVVRRDGKLYLLVPNVIFGAYQHALDSAGDEMLERNLASIGRVNEIFAKYTDFDLELEGHALNIYRGDAEREATEEEVLVPLTERRAATVRDALVSDGMAADRVETHSFGGSQPIVDVLDPEERWKNRRVEFIMVQK